MNRAFGLALGALLSLLSLAPQAAPTPRGADAIAPVVFNGTTFHYRWSQFGQFEFTPAGQEDLDAWTEMVTIWVYPTITDADALAAQANAVLAKYEPSGGQVLRTNSVPRTDARPAEHFIAGLLTARQRDRRIHEFVATRFVMIDGHGAAIIYSRRAYGDDGLQALGPWIAANGDTVERAAMAYDPSAVIPALRRHVD